MDCKVCGKAVISAGTKPKQYCSDACRMKYKRTFGHAEQTNIEQQTNTNTEHRNNLQAKTEQPDTFQAEQTDKTLDKCSEIRANTKVEQADTTAAEQPLASLPYKLLMRAIHSYPHDTWVDSPEHKELMRRLNSMTIAALEAEGYWIPAWRANQAS